MIIIFGIRRLQKAMGYVLLRCSNCGMSPVALFRVATWFTLFFIPVIPLHFKNVTVCPNCKRLNRVSKAQVESAGAQEDAARAPSQDGVERSVSSQTVAPENAVNQ